jgi:hypothetical protein
VRVATLFLMPALALADPKPTRLAMKRIDGTNLHMAGNRGAMNWRADVAITVDVRVDGKLDAASIGKTTDHVLDGGPTSRSTDVETAWTTRWTGTWSSAAGKLQLDLVLVDHKCKSERKMREFDLNRKLWLEYTPEVLPCKVASKLAKLECTSEQITLVDPATSRKTIEAAWRCNATTSSDLAESRSQWVLGKTACITTIGGKMSRDAFAPCVP